MENYFYFASIRKTIIQFLDIFNNIKIAKYDSDGTILNYITVPLKLAPKEKFYTWIHDRKNEKRLPMFGAYIEQISPAINERGNNKKIKFKTPDDEYITTNLIPYNINFKLSFATNYMVEADQILEQILPYFTPYVMIRVNLENYGISFDPKVILNDVSPDLDTTIEEKRLIKWDFSFTVHSYLLKPLPESKEIHNIYLQLKDYTHFVNPALSGTGLFETIHTSGYRDESAAIITSYEILDNE